MRGYGDSEKPPGVENYAIDLLVNDVKQVAEALGSYSDQFLAVLTSKISET
jgi:pimeloyl-ACP methyl ester carboxylesterase